MTATTPEYGGCPWPMDAEIETSAEWTAFSPEVRERALALASSTLARLTAYRVGNCPIKVRPLVRRAQCWVERGWITPTIADGTWRNTPLSYGCEVPLPVPVNRVTEVKVDGVVLAPADWRIDNNHRLVWQGAGDCPFPSSQDINLPDTAPGTMSVTYLNAYPVDMLGAHAVSVLALEYAKALTDTKCRLPKGVTAVVRQGVSYEINSGAFPDGFTGIQNVDAYIALWNPLGGKRTGPSRVWSPGQPQHRITTQGA